MPTVTGNLLDLLELLQDRPLWTGAELAERLGVDRRTVRRYVAALQGLGIPVAGARGAGGGYRLRPGYRMPPLMLRDGEASAAVLGLVAARRIGLADPGDADAALTKLRRILPAPLRVAVEALEASLSLTSSLSPGPATPSARLLALSRAVHAGRRVRVDYTRTDGTSGARELSPYGLVSHAGRWYLSAHDHGRGELRVYRVDRMGDPVLGAAAAPAPAGHDPAEHVQRSFARLPWTHAVEVWVGAAPETVRRSLPPSLAELEAEGTGTRVRMRVDSLDWMATVLAGLGADFAVREPDDLRAAVRRLADRLARHVAPDEPGAHGGTT